MGPESLACFNQVSIRLATAQEHRFKGNAALFGQIVPILAVRGLFIGSEHSFYRVLHANGRFHACGPITRIRRGAGTFPTCRPRSEACRCT